MDWWVVAIATGAGALALAWGVAADRRRARRLREAAAAPPQRRLPSLDEQAPPPAYVSEQAAFTPPRPAVTDPEAEAIALACRAGTALPGGWADAAFVTDAARRWAVVRDPLVLACSGVGSFRELLPAVAAAKRAGRALVVVAPAVEPQTLRTLAANAVQGHLPGVTVVCRSLAEVGQLATAAGATILSRDHLQSGWLPESALGRCAVWVSDRDHSWPLPTL